MTSTDGGQNRGVPAVPDAGAQRPLAAPASQSVTSHAQAQPSVRPPSGQAPLTSQLGGPYNQPTGTPGSAQWVSQGSQLRPGLTQWPATSMGGAHAYLSAATPVGAAGYRIPPNVSQAYVAGQSPAYVTASGVRSETTQQQQIAVALSQAPTSVPLQSLAGTMAFAAARPVGAPRAPGAAAPYRIPTSQAAAPRGQVPQISSQAYIKQASAQLQGFPGYPYPYLQAQGASAFPFGRGQPLSSTQMRPVGQPQMMQQLRPISNGQHVGGGLPASSALSNPYYPGGTRALSSYTGGRAVSVSGPTASIPHIKRPGAPKVEWLGPTSTHLIPGVITVSDRKVRVTPGEEETTPMYVLLRRWVQNDPGLPPPVSSQPDQPVSRLKLPKEALPEAPDLELPKPEPAHPSSAMFSPEDLLRVHKRHWKKVQRYHMVKRNIRLDRYCQHLAELIPEPNLRANSPMESDTPSQQQEAPRDSPITRAVTAVPSQPLAELTVTAQAPQQAPVAGDVTTAAARTPPGVASKVAGALESGAVPVVPMEVQEHSQLTALQ